MLLCFGGSPDKSLSSKESAYQSAVKLATSVLDAIVGSSVDDSAPNLLYTIEEWSDILEAPSHGLPPDIVMSAFRNRADYFGLVARDDAIGREVFERTIRIMVASHDRAWRDWQRIDAEAPARRPDMPAFALRFGGAMVGGRAIAAPPEFRDEEERLAYDAWVAEDARAQMLIDRKNKLSARLRRVEWGFQSMARNLYTYSNDAMRRALVERLSQASAGGEVDYLKLAKLPGPPETNSEDEPKRTPAGPFNAQLSGRALQAQREHDFLFTSLRYLADEARDDEDEQARVMSLLTAGGFSSGQLADAVYFIARPPSDTGRLNPEALAGRAEIARRMLMYGRTTYIPIDRDQLTMMNIEGMGLYVEIAGEQHVGDEARQIYNKVVESLRIAASWDRVEAAITELELLIAEQSDD